MRIEHAAMNMRDDVRMPEQAHKELEQLWIKQGRRTVTTKTARPVQGPKLKQLTPQRPVNFGAIQLDLKRKRLALLSLS
jgi:hypothetical protein